MCSQFIYLKSDIDKAVELELAKQTAIYTKTVEALRATIEVKDAEIALAEESEKNLRASCEILVAKHDAAGARVKDYQDACSQKQEIINSHAVVEAHYRATIEEKDAQCDYLRDEARKRIEQLIEDRQLVINENGKLAATIEAKDAELAELKSWREEDAETICNFARAEVELKARVKEMEGDLNRLIRHRDGEGGDSGFFQFFDRLVDEDTARTTDRIAFLEDGIAGRDTVILRLESDLAEAKEDTARFNVDDIRIVVAFILGWWPAYEDAISWDDEICEEDHSFYMAAKRIRAAIDDAKSK